MNATYASLLAQVREAGYELVQAEQPRPNRWLLLLRAPDRELVLVLAQQRPLVGAADVQDLAEALRLRRLPIGVLLALGGRFSAEAQRTAQELRQARIHLALALPPASSAPARAGILETA